jgi:short/branched chain acyl-CoA dehydrogenase
MLRPSISRTARSASSNVAASVKAQRLLLSTTTLKARPSSSNLVRAASAASASSRSFLHTSCSRYANPSPAADVVEHSENPTLPSLHTFTEEEELLRETVRKFSEEVVAPKVREMDENEKMDPEIIKGLFDNGVSGLQACSYLTTTSIY